jgi:hypothetical protein
MRTDPQALDPAALREVVQAKYGEAARTAQQGKTASCGFGACGCDSKDPITSDLYDTHETAGLPAEAVLAGLAPRARPTGWT